MAPKLFLLLHALFFSVVLLIVPYYCIVDPTSTTLTISQATTGTVCGIMADSQNRSIQCTTFQESVYGEYHSLMSGDVFIVVISMAASKLRWCGVPQINPPGPTFPVMDNVRVFSLKELKDATYNFSPDAQIGIGGYGIVYEGWLPDGRHVAVKRRDTRVPDSEAVFQSEVQIQAMACHENVVSLIGYCTENNERLCVFEYMPYRDLYLHLHPPTIWTRRYEIFYSWKLRIKVLLDVARGIEYLHRDCIPRVIHCDIKSANILLDENWVAKISDFGLAVIGPFGGQDRVDLASATGTAGYADPDSYSTANPFVSQRTDVYSFGVVMLEVVTGQMVYNALNNTSLATSAARTIAAGRLMEVLDKRLPLPVGFSMEAVENVARLAQRCVSPGAQRPNMSVVVIELENAVALFDQQEVLMSLWLENAVALFF